MRAVWPVITPASPIFWNGVKLWPQIPNCMRKWSQCLNRIAARTQDKPECMSDLKTSRKFHPIISREGWLLLAISFICAPLTQIRTSLAWARPFCLVTLFMIQLFRDPKRAPPPKQNVALCVADGRVVAIRTCHDPYAQCEALLISVFMNL